MTEYKVHVKWSGEKYSDVTLNSAEPPSLFKATVYSLTNVEPENQKIVIKGSPLGDDDWGTFKLRNNMTIMCIGTPSADVAKEPDASERPKFIEDMPDQENTGAPSGLVNLGNTCYLNATVQCFRVCPELNEAIRNSAASNSSTSLDDMVVKRLGGVFNTLNSNDADGGSPVTPAAFLQTFHAAYPQFAEKGDHGEPLQHDAEECWTLLMSIFSKCLPGKGGNGKSLIDQYFRGELKTVTKNSENPDEEAVTSSSTFHVQKCHISNDVNLMNVGIKSSLKGTVEKRSPTLDRDCIYEQESTINRLPGYLCVQFVRFFWKQDKGKKVKIVRNVKFGDQLDMYEYCSPELKEKLKVMRNKMKELDDKNSSQTAEDVVMDVDKKEKTYEPFSFEEDQGSNNSGKYRLKAVLTHKGMYADGGHYVAWVREADSDKWILFDDDKVSLVKQEEVLKLSGGGEFHSAYLLLYEPLKLEKTD